MQVLRWVEQGIGKEFSSTFVNKESVVSVEELQALTSEQRAAVDILVLKECSAFVGLSLSSMSFLVQELRVLSGHPRNTTVLIGETLHPKQNEALFKNTLVLKDATYS